MNYEINGLSREMSQTLGEIHDLCFESSWATSEFDELFEMTGIFGLSATRASKTLGFILMRQAGNEAEILTLVVRPVDQRKGCGRILLTSSLSLASANGCQEVFLEVARDNKAALTLYLNCGFKQVGTRPNYYRRLETSPAVDALVLRCPVADLAVEITK